MRGVVPTLQGGLLRAGGTEGHARTGPRKLPESGGGGRALFPSTCQIRAGRDKELVNKELLFLGSHHDSFYSAILLLRKAGF